MISPKRRGQALFALLYMLLLLLLPLLPLLLPLLLWRRRQLLRGPNGGMRKRIGTPNEGTTLRLSHGETFVRFDGDDAIRRKQPTVVLVHGNVGWCMGTQR